MQGRLSSVLVVLALMGAGCMSRDDTVEPAATVAPAEDTQGAAAPPANATAAAPETPNATIERPKVEVSAVSNGFYPINPAYVVEPSQVASGSIVTVTYRNEDLNPLGSHDWVLEGVEGSGTAVIGVGEEANARFVAPEPGAYTYYCSVEGHRERGMEGTLTVV